MNDKMANQVAGTNSAFPEFIPEEDVAKILGKSLIFLWRERRAGKITAHKFGRDVMYDSKEVRAYIDRQKLPAAMAAAA